MQNDFNITKENVLIQNKVGTKNEQIESAINLSGKNVEKILSVGTCFNIVSSESLVGEVTYNANLVNNIVYKLEDGTIENTTLSTPLSSRFENELLTATSSIFIIPNIISNEIEKIGEDNFKIKTNVELSFTSSNNQEIDIYAGGDENVFVMQTEIPLSSLTAKNCSLFTQPIILEAKCPVDSVLSTHVGAITTKTESLDSMVVVEGKIFANALIKSAEETPRIFAISNLEDFREEIEDGNVKENNQIVLAAKVVCEDIKTEIQENGESVEISVPVDICYDVVETRNVTVVTDAYSVKNEITTTTGGFNSTELLPKETFEFKFDGNISLDEETPRVDKIIATDGSYLTITNISLSDNELLVEGIVKTNLIYLNDDENKLNSINIEIPFSETQRANTNFANNIIYETFVSGVDASAKKGREIFIDGKITLAISPSTQTSHAVISNVEIGEEIESSTSAIEIYFANAGQTLWDIAKDLKVSKDTLALQNSDLPEVMEGGEKVVYYNQKTLN